MAVVMVHNNENVEIALGRFTRQVIREGIISDILDHRYKMKASDVRRERERELARSRRRKRRRARRKPQVQLKLNKLR